MTLRAAGAPRELLLSVPGGPPGGAAGAGSASGAPEYSTSRGRVIPGKPQQTTTRRVGGYHNSGGCRRVRLMDGPHLRRRGGIVTTATGVVLVSQVMPILAGAIARGAVQPVGAEDIPELTSEGCALAAAALESLESRDKQVAANSVAFYALQRLKSGRRSCGGGATDVMSAGAALCGRARLASMDEPAGRDDAGEGGMTLHELLAAQEEGPDEIAARDLDWAELAAGLGPKQLGVVRGVARGESGMTMAAALGVSSPRITQIKGEVAGQIRSRWGEGCIAASCRPPAWRRDINAGRERRAARYARSRA